MQQGTEWVKVTTSVTAQVRRFILVDVTAV
jgi:hypothetical protein